MIKLCDGQLTEEALEPRIEGGWAPDAHPPPILGFGFHVAYRVQFLFMLDPVRPGDFPQVVAVWEASVRASHDFLTEADIQFFKPFVGDALLNMGHLACVRDDAGDVVGFIGVMGHRVEMLFVHPQWQGRGVGRQLLEYAVKTLGATHVDVNEQNHQAVEFYKKMGFVVNGRSELDTLGKPFPLLHLIWNSPS